MAQATAIKEEVLSFESMPTPKKGIQEVLERAGERLYQQKECQLLESFVRTHDFAGTSRTSENSAVEVIESTCWTLWKQQIDFDSGSAS